MAVGVPPSRWSGCATFRRAQHDRVRFHCWLQWLLDEQLATAGAEIALLGDLAIGFDPAAPTHGCGKTPSLTACASVRPPTRSMPTDRDWGLPPFVPWKLRAVGYERSCRRCAAALEHCGALRVDHVMGLFRLFWIPDGGVPSDGTYVRFPSGDLLDIVALESDRAGAVIVGEDLGTVEDEVREQLAERAVLSYRLVWFEEEPPELFPAQALAAVTTHDLPTIAGVWSASDDQADGALHDRLMRLTQLPATTSVDDVVVAVHEALSAAPSMIVTATLDDAMRVTERPNLPGTTVDVRTGRSRFPFHSKNSKSMPWRAALRRPCRVRVTSLI